MNDEQKEQLKDAIDKVSGMKHRAIIIFGSDDMDSGRATTLSAGEVVNVNPVDLRDMVENISGMESFDDEN